MKPKNLINSIITGNISDEELKKIFLNEDKNIAILFAAIKTIGSKKIFDEQIKNKLIELSEIRELDIFIMGNYSIGDLAIASLILNNISTNDIPVYSRLPLDRKESIDELVEYPNW